MADDGLGDQVWRIVSYERGAIIAEERIPLTAASEQEIIARLEALARAAASERDIRRAPHLFKAVREQSSSIRISYSAGANPRHVASLWRMGELDDTN